VIASPCSQRQQKDFFNSPTTAVILQSHNHSIDLKMLLFRFY